MLLKKIFILLLFIFLYNGCIACCVEIIDLTTFDDFEKIKYLRECLVNCEGQITEFSRILDSYTIETIEFIYDQVKQLDTEQQIDDFVAQHVSFYIKKCEIIVIDD